MTKLMICVLMLGGLAVAGDKKGGNAEAVAKCKDGCAKRYESCMKANKPESKTKAAACEQSRSTCNGACNK